MMMLILNIDDHNTKWLSHPKLMDTQISVKV